MTPRLDKSFPLLTGKKTSPSGVFYSSLKQGFFRRQNKKALEKNSQGSRFKKEQVVKLSKFNQTSEQERDPRTCCRNRPTST